MPMNVLSCPSCRWSDRDATRGDLSLCPHCGSPLQPGPDFQVDPSASREEEALVAQLREAFGAGSRGLGGASADRARQPDVLNNGPGAITRDTAVERAPGSRLADFEILSEIGRGGMGIVYHARQISLDRPVALKVMTGARRLGPTAVERFHREARAAARLNHANVVPVYAQGEDNDTQYYAMKLVDGVSLDVAIQSRPELLSSTHHISASSQRAVERLAPLPRRASSKSVTAAPPSLPPPAPAPSREPPVRRSLQDFRYMARLLAGAAEGLAHAHQSGVIHRDIKPHNLILGDDLQLHLTDFGLAYLAAESHITLSGEVMGTPAYLSPEQVRGDLGAIDHRTDIYSLGVTLYEMITRHRPFELESRDQVLHAIAEVEPRGPRQWDPSIPRDLETICLRAMNKNPAARHPTAADLAEDLRRFSEGRPILSRRAGVVERSLKWARRHRSLAAAIFAVVSVFVVGGGWSMSAAAANRREGNVLLGDAYRKLVYQDYQQYAEVVPLVDRAEQLRADPLGVQVARALVDLGRSDNPSAIAKLQPVVATAPHASDWSYLLAWAMYRDRRRDEAVQLVKQLDAAGGPLSEDGWFFRGMAVHQHDPVDAIRSHRQAIALRAGAREFFPQAGLHLARAYNQLIYGTRTPDGLAEAEPILRRLVEEGHYGARPHYLLSIAHRLTGEILRDSRGARPGDAEKHFESAIDWARKGIEKDPMSDRPVTALAEALEQLGLYADAVAQRTRALELAVTPASRCEALHYRWRLNYWMGNYAQALDDLTAYDAARAELHYADRPGQRVKDPWHQHVYRTLVLADQGHLDAARGQARNILTDDPDDPVALILSRALLVALGVPHPDPAWQSARWALEGSAPSLDSGSVPGWRSALVDFVDGATTLDVLDAMAQTAEQPYRLKAEAYFYAGLLAIGHGDRPSAFTYFTNSHQFFDSEAAFSYHARVLLPKMLADPDWPRWSATSGSGRSDSGRRSSTSVRSGEIGHDPKE